MSRFVCARYQRQLSGVLIGVLLLSVACAPSSSSSSRAAPQATADAQARRAALAETQRLLSGEPTPTATTEPTPAPRPSCQDAVWWHQARAYVGQSRTVEGNVVRTRPAANAMTMLEIGQLYPDPTGFTALVPADAASRLMGKRVCVAGRIGRTLGFASIEVRDPASDIVVVD
jgi:hypothetical protein